MLSFPGRVTSGKLLSLSEVRLPHLKIKDGITSAFIWLPFILNETPMESALGTAPRRTAGAQGQGAPSSALFFFLYALPILLLCLFPAL